MEADTIYSKLSLSCISTGYEEQRQEPTINPFVAQVLGIEAMNMEGKSEESKELVELGDENNEINLVMTVDEVLENYVGAFGFSQLLHVLLVSLAWVFDAQNMLVTIFTDAQPSAWRSLSGGGGGGGGGGDGSAVCELVAGSWEWVDGRQSTTVAEWGLICDSKFLAAAPASLFFLGSLLGSAVYGRLADSFLGRKRTILVSCLLTSLTTFLTSLSPNIWTYATLRFVNGFVRSGIGICCIVLSTEAVGREWRGQVGQFSFFFFSSGFLSLPIVAHLNRTSWRGIYKTISCLPLLYSLFLLPFVAESPRWLLIRGRQNEALNVLKTFAKLNGKELPANVRLSVYTSSGGGEVKQKGLWETKWASKRMIIVIFTGTAMGFTYYGMQLNVENLNFNLYTAVAVNAVIEVPAVFIGGVLLGHTKRRLLFPGAAFAAGFLCFLCAILRKPKGYQENKVQLGIESLGFLAASTAFDVLWIYCLEMFPTNVRNFAVSMLRQSFMLGASMVPLLVVIGRVSPSLSILVIGVFSILSGILSQWLPETKDAPLHETLEQQEEEEQADFVSQEAALELGKFDKSVSG